MAGIPIEQTISFGTDGVRGNAEQFPFTQEALIAFGGAVACWAREKYCKTTPRILIGADTRISSPRIKKDLMQGMLSQKIAVFDADVLPTPALYQIIAHDDSFDAGIVVSASHNPYYDNGIKVFDARRCKIGASDEQIILQFFEQFLQDHDMHAPLHPQVWPEAATIYQQRIQSLFKADFLKKVKVVLDCANGATSIIAPTIFKALGAQVLPVASNPDGININDRCGSLHPEMLARAVREYNADCGFAFDGDGDRVVAVNWAGQIKDGDDILALLLALPAYGVLDRVVGTVMSNQGFAEHLAQAGKRLIRTHVGEKHVVERLAEENVPLGGEISGHIIVRDYLATGDGIFVALKVLESIINHNNWDMKTFTKYPQVLINVPVTQKKDLTQAPFALLIEEYEKKLGGGRVLVRYSGTEHVLRVMTEAPTLDTAQVVAEDLAHTLQEALKASLQ